MPPPVLKFHPGLRHVPSGRTLPAMVAGVQTLDGRITAVHRTYLCADGRAKADVTPCKMTLGPLGSSAVQLGPVAPAMGVAEGIETALSVAQLFRIPCWARVQSSKYLKKTIVSMHVCTDSILVWKCMKNSMLIKILFFLQD